MPSGAPALVSDASKYQTETENPAFLAEPLSAHSIQKSLITANTESMKAERGEAHEHARRACELIIVFAKIGSDLVV